MATVCCACHQQLSSECNKKNIFRDDLLIQSASDKAKETNDSLEKMKLYSGIELITGHKIFETGGSPPSLCDPCFQKLEGFMNFRAQLLSSFGIIFNGQSSFNPLKQNSIETQSENPQDLPKDNDFDYLAVETSDCPKLPDRKSASDDLINVDENSTSLDFNDIQNGEDDTNDSTNCSRLQNDQENNNLNDSDSSNDNIDVQNYEDHLSRVQDNDIESEIDVCSGEDEVLEMEDEIRKENITEVQSSSESEIEVCDYEPTGKRIKNVNTLSQPIPF